MADPKANSLITQDQIDAACGNDGEKPIASSSPGRSLRSRGNAALFPGAGGEAGGKTKPPSLPGRTLPTKRLLYQQELLTQPPSVTAPQPPPPSSPPPTAPAVLAEAAKSPQRVSTLCNWAQAVICDLPGLLPLNCQFPGGCDKLVHHLCQATWEQRRGHDEVLARYCCFHHPQYKYRTQPEKMLATPPPAKNVQGRSNSPPREVIQNPSPAESTLTGVGGRDDTAGAKSATAEGARGRRWGKRKEPPETGDDDDRNTTNNPRNTNHCGGGVQFAPELFEEGHADGSITGGDSDEVGDLGDSDIEGEEADIHNEGLNLRTVLEGSNEAIGNDANNIDPFGGEEFDDGRDGAVTDGRNIISGAPEGWFPPGPPSSWKGYEPKIDLGAPDFAAVDNPGSWNLFSYDAKYGRLEKGNKERGMRKYLGHFTPALAKVVPPDENGNREVKGWKFHYNGWTPDAFDRQTYVRDDANAMNLKPESRRGSLDVIVLKKHGCDGNRVRDDPLFFYQLLFPFCDPELNEIEDDYRMPYFSHVANYTNIYAATSGAGIGMGHAWQGVTVPELVRWTGIPIRHGALDGKPGTISCRWDSLDPRYDSVIDDAMSMDRWKKIKRYFKLNNNIITKPRGQPGYDPCSKYDFIYQCLVCNMNYLTLVADGDGTIDETSWGFGGYGTEACFRVNGKQINKGGQTTLLYDINRRYPRAYIHRHKLQPRPQGFTAQGPAEVFALVQSIDKLLQSSEPRTEREQMVLPNPSGQGERVFSLKPVYKKPPHLVADNHFSGDEVMEFLGSKGYGATMTNRRDRFPDGLKPYLHHKKVPPGCAKAKAMRFEMPIVAIKQEPAPTDESAKAYTRTMVSFQSTGATNICGVNNLPSVSLYVSKRVRGKGRSKRVWGIEQNEARETYLGHYYGIDNLDHMIKNCSIRYITWKYWHAPYLHAQAMGVVAAYDMYMECADGQLDNSWAIPMHKRMSFTQFRIKLSEQMLTYDPRHNNYPGDSKFRRYTQQHKLRRSTSGSVSENSADDEVSSNDGLTLEVFKRARALPRFCKTLDDIHKHFSNIVKLNNAMKCEVCGEKTIWRCEICNKNLCTMSKRTWNGAKCVLTYHNEEFYGLARSDFKSVHGKNIDHWIPPETAAINRNARRVRRFLLELKENDNVEQM